MAEPVLFIATAIVCAATLGGWAFIFLTVCYDGYAWLVWRDMGRAVRWVGDGVAAPADRAPAPSLRIIDGGGA